MKKILSSTDSIRKSRTFLIRHHRVFDNCRIEDSNLEGLCKYSGMCGKTCQENPNCQVYKFRERYGLSYLNN